MKSCEFRFYEGCCLCRKLVSLAINLNNNTYKIGDTIPITIICIEGNTSRFIIAIDRMVSMISEKGKLIKKKKSKIITMNVLRKLVRPAWVNNKCKVEINMGAELSIKALNDIRKHHSYYNKSICCEYYIRILLENGVEDVRESDRKCVLYLIE